jgi:hypothetical protein
MGNSEAEEVDEDMTALVSGKIDVSKSAILGVIRNLQCCT